MAVSVSTLHSVYGAQYNSTFFSQVSSFAMAPGVSPVTLSGSGQIEPTLAAIGSVSPTLSFSTSQIATVLTAVGIDGATIASSTLFKSWFQKKVLGGINSAGSTHKLMTVTNGIIVPESISASTSSPATISYKIYCVKDSTNAPIIWTPSSALAGTPTATELYYAGPVKFNSTTINDVQSITINFGIEVWVRSGSGEHQPSYCCIGKRSPSISIQTGDIDKIDTIGPEGLSLTSSTIYLRQGVQGGTRTADATATHIAFTGYEGMIYCGDANASEGPASTTYTILPMNDGTHAALGVSTTSAIS